MRNEQNATPNPIEHNTKVRIYHIPPTPHYRFNTTTPHQTSRKTAPRFTYDSNTTATAAVDSSNQHRNARVLYCTLALVMICLARASEPSGSLQGWQTVGSSCVSSTERASPSLRSFPKFFTRFVEEDFSREEQQGGSCKQKGDKVLL